MSPHLPAENETQSQHSILPWRLGEMCGGKVLLKNDVGRPIAEIGTHHLMQLEANANARFIVTACNQHDSLLAQRDALKAALQQLVEHGAFPADAEAVAFAALAFTEVR